MYDELKKLSQATLAGIRGADTSAGTGNAVVDNFAATNFRDAISQSTNIGAGATQAAAAEEEAARAARATEMQKIQDKLNPEKYSMRRKEDGGFDFLDPEGNAVDINKFSQITGQRPSDILKYSDNPLDQQYVNDYSNTKGIIDAIQQGDNDTLTGYLQQNEAIDPNSKPEDLMRELIRRYPHIYGNGRYADTMKNNGNSLIKFNQGTGMTDTAGATGISTSDYGY